MSICTTCPSFPLLLYHCFLYNKMYLQRIISSSSFMLISPRKLLWTIFICPFANLRTWHLPIAVNMIRNHSIVINLLLESKYKITSIFTATCSQCVSKVKKYIYLFDFFHMKIFYTFCWLVMYSIYYFNMTSKKCSINGQKILLYFRFHIKCIVPLF